MAAEEYNNSDELYEEVEPVTTTKKRKKKSTSEVGGINVQMPSVNTARAANAAVGTTLEQTKEKLKHAGLQEEDIKTLQPIELLRQQQSESIGIDDFINKLLGSASDEYIGKAITLFALAELERVKSQTELNQALANAVILKVVGDGGSKELIEHFKELQRINHEHNAEIEKIKSEHDTEIESIHASIEQMRQEREKTATEELADAITKLVETQQEINKKLMENNSDLAEIERLSALREKLINAISALSGKSPNEISDLIGSAAPAGSTEQLINQLRKWTLGDKDTKGALELILEAIPKNNNKKPIYGTPATPSNSPNSAMPSTTPTPNTNSSNAASNPDCNENGNNITEQEYSKLPPDYKFTLTKQQLDRIINKQESMQRELNRIRSELEKKEQLIRQYEAKIVTLQRKSAMSQSSSKPISSPVTDEAAIESSNSTTPSSPPSLSPSPSPHSPASSLRSLSPSPEGETARAGEGESKRQEKIEPIERGGKERKEREESKEREEKVKERAREKKKENSRETIGARLKSIEHIKRESKAKYRMLRNKILKEAVLEFIRRNPGCYRQQIITRIPRLRKNTALTSQILKELQNEHLIRIEDSETTNKRFIYPTEITTEIKK